MRQQRGSVTVIALIMLLFLVIVGGAWTIMMTQEKTNAFANEKQQQAWYAAEAGYKRAAMLLTRPKTEWVGNNLDWSWTTYDATKFKSKSESDLTKISLADGSKLTDDTKVKTLPWYAVNIDVITDSNYADYAFPTTTQTYTITSIGEYMGERKVIRRTVKLTVTGDSSPTNPSGLAGNNIIISGGHVNLSGNTTINAGNVSGIVTQGYNGNNNVSYTDTNGNTYKGSSSIPTTSWTDDYTKLQAGLFDNLNTLIDPAKYFNDTSDYYNDQNTKTISSTISVTKNLHLQSDTTISGKVNVSAGTKALLYDDTNLTLSAKSVVNVASGGLLVFMTSGEFTWTGQNKNTYNANGDIIIISRGKVTIDKMYTGPNTRVYIIADNEVAISNSTIANCFIAANKLNFSGGQNNFTGQFFTKESVDLGSGTVLTGDNSVLSYFGYPSTILATITKS